jgi:hypothetical protein
MAGEFDEVPQKTGKTITFVAGLRHDKMGAPMVFNGAMTGEMFVTYPALAVPTISGIQDMFAYDQNPSKRGPRQQDMSNDRKTAAVGVRPAVAICVYRKPHPS